MSVWSGCRKTTPSCSSFLLPVSKTISEFPSLGFLLSIWNKKKGVFKSLATQSLNILMGASTTHQEPMYCCRVVSVRVPNGLDPPTQLSLGLLVATNEHFISAPVLIHVDPAGQFVVICDIPDIGVGAVFFYYWMLRQSGPSMFFFPMNLEKEHIMAPALPTI